jgi:hypothetical protein
MLDCTYRLRLWVPRVEAIAAILEQEPDPFGLHWRWNRKPNTAKLNKTPFDLNTQLIDNLPLKEVHQSIANSVGGWRVLPTPSQWYAAFFQPWRFVTVGSASAGIGTLLLVLNAVT